MSFMFAIITACGSKKTTETVDETAADTVIVVKTDSDPEISDTITIQAPVNETAKQSEAKAEQPALKFDLNGKGTIVQKGDIWVIRTTGSGGTDYLPSNLDDKFKVDGKEVTFTANLLPIPKGVRMAGNPITLVSIK
ncbi:MAG: hypothetical protein IPO24_00350 [Bacteroidetes bacterium]|nr:hypothetical protein [Bacteroidota bacterium]